VGNSGGHPEHADCKRTGYSGEDGFEVYIPSDEATTVKMWNALLDAGAEFGIRPCGLGARNTLRLEAGMSLYGHEISEDIDVFEAGLDRFGSRLDKGEFIGREALAGGASRGRPEAQDRRTRDDRARHRARRVRSAHSRRQRIGTVTSGSARRHS
jgi:glycine cleavage system aminomethyltransferase T